MVDAGSWGSWWRWRRRRWRSLLACGSGRATGSGTGSTTGGTARRRDGAAIRAWGAASATRDILAITVISPGTATIESVDGTPVAQAFTATGKLPRTASAGDHTSMVTWAASGQQIGGIDATGLYSCERLDRRRRPGDSHAARA